MRIFKFLFAFLVLVFTHGSCQNEKPPEKREKQKNGIFSLYPYEEDLEFYLAETLNLKSSPDTLLFVPLNGCEKCIKKTLSAVKSNKFYELLIIGGAQDQFPIYSDLLSDITKKTNVYFDSIGDMNRYNIDVFGPTIIVKNKTKTSYCNIDPKNIDQVLLQLGWSVPKEKTAN